MKRLPLMYGPLLLLLVRWTTGIGEEFYEIPANYKTTEPPERPVKVNLTFTIEEIMDVDDIRNELELEGGLDMGWRDERIIIKSDQIGQNESVLLDLKVQDTIWTPDLWIESLRGFNVKKSIEQQATLTLDKDKNFDFWQSVSIKISCPMNFNYYPFDIQHCSLRFSANGLDMTQQQFEGTIVYSPQVHYSQGGLNYKSVEIRMDANTSFLSDVSGIVWPQLRALFSLERRKADHILQTFLPTGCLVCLSWISFLIPPYIVPGRMVLLVTLLLVVFSTYQSEHQRSPRSSDLKALDIWFVGCMIFVLGAVCEYAALLYIKRLIIRKRNREQDKEKEDENSSASASETSKTTVKIGSSLARISALTPRYRSAERRIRVAPAGGSNGSKNSCSRHVQDSGSEYGDINDTDLTGEETLEKIDVTALMVFPVCFLIFNLAYWSHYVLVGDQQ